MPTPNEEPINDQPIDAQPNDLEPISAELLEELDLWQQVSDEALQLVEDLCS